MQEVEPRIEERYEFDAPHYYDFTKEGDASPERADLWFSTRVPSPASCSKTKPRTSEEMLGNQQDQPLMENSGESIQGAQEGKPAKEATADTPAMQPGTNVHPIKKFAKGISNIVTSWGAPAARIPAKSAGSTAVEPASTVAGKSGSAKENGVSLSAIAIPKREGFVTPRRPKPPRKGDTEVLQASEVPKWNISALEGEMQPKADPASPQSKLQQNALDSGNEEGLCKPLSFTAGQKELQPRRMSSVSKQNKSRTLPPKNPKAVVSNSSSDLKGTKLATPSGHNPNQGEQRSSKKARTTPHSAGAPDLATSNRSRPPKYKSREQLEEEEMAAMPQFKARPYSGSKMAHKKTPPIWERPVPVKAGEHPAEIPEQPAFKARPLDSKILSGPTFVPRMGSVDCTQAKSPALSTRSRTRSKEKPQPLKEHQPPASRTEWKDELTEVKPFHLETERRSEVAKALKGETKKRKLEEVENAPEFKAQPVPLSHYQTPHMPVSNPVLTMPEPFSLESERRHQEAQVLQELMNQQASELERKQRTFKARAVQKGRSVLPTVPEKLLTVPEPFALPGDARSLDRAAYDAEMHERGLARQAAEQAEAERRREEEARELAKLRQSLQFKARPMPSYPSAAETALQPPPLKWTEPISPKLQTAKRARSNNNG